MKKLVLQIAALIVFLYIIYSISCRIKEGLLPYDPKVDEIKRRLMLVNKKAADLKYFTDKKSYTITNIKCTFVLRMRIRNIMMIIIVSICWITRVRTRSV